MKPERTRHEVAAGLKWRADNLRRSASDALSRARELEKCADEMLQPIPQDTEQSDWETAAKRAKAASESPRTATKRKITNANSSHCHQINNDQ